MIIIQGEDIQNIKLKDTAVALGSFDAIHLGHRAIIKRVSNYAKDNNLKSLVYMFRLSPRNVIFLESIDKSINSIDKRIEIIKNFNVDYLVIDDFTEEYSKITYTEFVSTYLKSKLGAKYICAGFNYKFGYRGEGTTQRLKELCNDFKIQVEIQDCVKLDNIVSSTYIRRLISQGSMEKSAEYLGRYFSTKGKVIYGNQLGSELGFPTANIEIPNYQVVPKFGVYISFVEIDGKHYPSITNVGGKPTVTETGLNIETHIIGFSGNLYGKNLEVNFCKLIREISKFDKISDLKSQLNIDKKRAIEYFKNGINSTIGQ